MLGVKSGLNGYPLAESSNDFSNAVSRVLRVATVFRYALRLRSELAYVPGLLIHTGINET